MDNSDQRQFYGRSVDSERGNEICYSTTDDSLE